MDKLEKMLYIVNEDGEIIDTVSSDETVAKLQVGDRVIRKDGTRGEKMVSIKMQFGKVNPLALASMSKNKVLPLILEYMEYETGRLVHSNGLPIKRKNLPKVCGLSRNTVDKYLKELIDNETIKIVKGGRDDVFYVNPYVAHAGPRVNLSLYEMFKNSRWAEQCRKMIKR